MTVCQIISKGLTGIIPWRRQDTIDEAEDLCDELAEKLQEIDGVTAE